MLETVGKKAFSLKWWLVLAWLVVLGVLGAVVSQTGMSTTSSLSIPGTQAQQTLERFNELFPEAGAQSAKIVIQTNDSTTVAAHKDAITALTHDVAQVDGVTAALSPFEIPGAISEDSTIAFITVQLKGAGDDNAVSEETISSVMGLVEQANNDHLTVAAGGDLVSKQLGEILGIGEIVGVVIALLVLVITFGSLTAAGMPLVTAIVAVGVSMAGLFSLSGVIELSTTAPVLAVMLGLAVGIDYSLFIINRYRTFVKEGYSLQDAAGRAVATAGNAVLFAAATVVIALAALSVVQIPFMTVMGLAAAATVAIAALVSITLVPALLGIIGLRVFGKKARKQIVAIQKKGDIHHERISHKTAWYKWGETLLRFRKTILVGALVVISLVALPVGQLQLGLPTDETAAQGTSARTSYELLAKGFGPGYNGPLLVVAEGLPETTATEKAYIASKRLPEQYASLVQAQKIANNIAKLDGVKAAQAALSTDNGTKAVIQVVPSTGPSEKATQGLVTALRNEETIKQVTESDAISLGVTGTTAVQIDINKKLADALPVYLAVVVGISLLVLVIAFRSILIPLKATLGFLLSVLAMFGALVAVFQFGWFGIAEAPGPIVSFIPIIAIGILFGLAMDYEFFLVSGMQEEYHRTKNAQKAVVQGFALGSRVVLAAGLIMVAVFAGFVGNHDTTIQSIGFALAVGIFVDAFIVRMVIVPIVMSYLGKAAWWMPKWLDKILPKISVEGAVEERRKS